METSKQHSLARSLCDVIFQARAVCTVHTHTRQQPRKCQWSDHSLCLSHWNLSLLLGCMTLLELLLRGRCCCCAVALSRHICVHVLYPSDANAKRFALGNFHFNFDRHFHCRYNSERLLPAARPALVRAAFPFYLLCQLELCCMA